MDSIKAFQRRSRQSHIRARKRRIENRIKDNEKMRYTPKERATYRKALRYGRTLKPDGKFRTAPRLKFDGGRLAVARDSKGNVSIRANGSVKGNVRMLGPRGVKWESNLNRGLNLGASSSPAVAKRAFKVANKILSIVGKGTYKKGSTGSRGG